MNMVELIGLGVYVLITIAVKNLFFKAFMKNPKNVSGLAGLCITIILIPAYVLAVKKYSKNIRAEAAELENVEVDPTEAQVDKYIELVQKYGISNNPQSWNKVRGFWFIANESPYVTTEKKTKLRNFLMSQGLRLTGKDKDIIDNYNK